MTAPWAVTTEPEPHATPGDVVTTIDGSSFCITDTSGRVRPPLPRGLFVRDTRLVSRWELLVAGRSPEPLAVWRTEPYSATFVGRVQPAGAMLVLQRHHVGDGMRVDLEVRNPRGVAADCLVELRVDTDFADLFEVKEGRPPERRDVTVTAERGVLKFASRGRGTALFAGGDASVEDRVIRWNASIPPHASWTACIEIREVRDGVTLSPRHPCGQPLEHTVPARELREWRSLVPEVTTADQDLATVLAHSVEDLGALRMVDPAHPDRPIVAAGAPWYMALFGRDSLITSWMLLPLEHRLALGTLRTLAEHQGTRTDPETEEQPGRILHEMRFGPAASLALGGGSAYYGTADATSLFVMLLGELHRWGVEPQWTRALLPHADRALEWIERHGDADGDGFVEYRRTTERGLPNQGWKDSWDAITFADGEIARAPIALAEVQAYTYAAYRARADLAETEERRQVWTDKALALKRAFNERFWLPDRNWYAVGLDAGKRPIDSLTSNIGHCLWTGIVDEDKAAAVAGHLMSPEMFSGWGIRTLAESMAAYDPMSYHNGSVWPHDNALCAAGLMRYGFVEEARRVAVAVLDSAVHFGHRLPELFCGFSRDEFAVPVPYPTSCAPQAWAAATPLHLLRTLLGLRPEAGVGSLRFTPALPGRYLPLRIRGLRVGAHLLTVDVSTDGAWITGLNGLGDGRPAADTHSG
ncbi:glycogen debranching N-terminal domain-containing protein [Lentzea sp. HUAS12]|uniref:amylo-alpha-1,6-glucosidase n=1 Tax=Lentzea sp. HUAS12 TaxID=2951806 RepID=UPI00209E309C|nr:glycogen debranching N-terminal domain-containing protein [Lentzea sp. HUAS12]USX54384.1 amylo-alpha-1,6-glucosidase [Lentzea sp. HUAS12]